MREYETFPGTCHVLRASYRVPGTFLSSAGPRYTVLADVPLGTR